MKLISHRGNTKGPNKKKENHPEHLNGALELGFDVELDIWYVDDKLILGHDKPQYEVELKWLTDRVRRLWVHCKNVESLMFFEHCSYPIHYFWHQEDDFTLTSQNIIWTYPKKTLTLNSVCVMPEGDGIHNKEQLPECRGVCSDYILNFK